MVDEVVPFVAVSVQVALVDVSSLVYHQTWVHSRGHDGT